MFLVAVVAVAVAPTKKKKITKCPVDRGAGKVVVPPLQAWALRARSSEDP